MATPGTRNTVAEYSPSILVIAASGSLYPPHRQNGFEIIYLERGTGTVYACGRVCRMQPGDLFFINHGVTHGFAFDRDSHGVLAGISRELMPQFTEVVNELQIPFYLIPDARGNRQIDQAIGHVVERPSICGSGIKLMGEFGLLLDALATQFGSGSHLPSPREETFEDRLAGIAYREADTERPALDHIATKLDVSKSYASRLFKPTLGLPLPVYCAVARIGGARRLLIQSPAPIKEIARMCHYESLRTFNRQFQDIAGMTATEYRERYSPSKIINYDLPRYRDALEGFYGRLAETCPAI